MLVMVVHAGARSSARVRGSSPSNRWASSTELRRARRAKRGLCAPESAAARRAPVLTSDGGARLRCERGSCFRRRCGGGDQAVSAGVSADNMLRRRVPRSASAGTSASVRERARRQPPSCTNRRELPESASRAFRQTMRRRARAWASRGSLIRSTLYECKMPPNRSAWREELAKKSRVHTCCMKS